MIYIICIYCKIWVSEILEYTLAYVLNVGGYGQKLPLTRVLFSIGFFQAFNVTLISKI